jgi:hypothetical protein
VAGVDEELNGKTFGANVIKTLFCECVSVLLRIEKIRRRQGIS